MRVVCGLLSCSPAMTSSSPPPSSSSYRVAIQFNARSSNKFEKRSLSTRFQVHNIFLMFVVVLLICLVNLIQTANLSFKVLSLQLHQSIPQKMTLFDTQLTRAWPRRYRSRDHSPHHENETANVSTTTMKTKTTTIDVSWISDVPKFRVCRFNHACLHRDGTILIITPSPAAPSSKSSSSSSPSPLEDDQKDDKHLSTTASSIPRLCRHATVRAISDTGTDETDKRTFIFDERQPTTHFNLLSQHPARWHIPHFITDALPMLFAASMVTGRIDKLLNDPSFLNSSSHRHRTCLRWLPQPPLIEDSVNGSVKTMKQKRKKRKDDKHMYEHSVPCEQVQNIDERYTAMLVEHKVLRLAMTDWIPTVIAMFPGNPLVHSLLTLFQTWSSSSSPPPFDDLDSVKCFASITTFPNSVYALPSKDIWLRIASSLWSLSSPSLPAELKTPMATTNTTGASVNPDSSLISSSVADTTSTTAKSAVAPCRPQIVILNRDQDVSVSRTVSATQISELQSCIFKRSRNQHHQQQDDQHAQTSSIHNLKSSASSSSSYSSSSLSQFSSPPIEPTFTSPLFERMSVRAQMEAVHAADVLVGAHGAALSNIVFVREGTHIVEIFPHAYYTGPYDGISRVLALPYTAVKAFPDQKGFYACVDNFSKERMITPEEGENAFKAWNDSLIDVSDDHGNNIAKYNNTKKVFDFSNFNAFKYYMYRLCARAQALRVDVDGLCDVVVDTLKEVCTVK